MLQRIGKSVSLIRVDLPLPETPQTPIIFDVGNFTLIFFKLFPEHPVISKDPFLFKSLSILGIFSFPLRYLDVSVSALKILAEKSLKIISPPFFPAPGPMSII